MNHSPLYQHSRPNPNGYRDVTAQQVRAHAAGSRIVDVREPAEFTGELGHLPGAELCPLATLPAAAGGWDRDAELLLVCRSGGRSGRGAAQLAALGFRHVMNMEGGMLAYRQIEPLSPPQGRP